MARFFFARREPGAARSSRRPFPSLFPFDPPYPVPSLARARYSSSPLILSSREIVEMAAVAEPIRIAKGLEGVIVDDTAVCSVEQGGLWYRGYEIHDLSKHATFEEVAFLLLVGHKPGAAELQAF